MKEQMTAPEVIGVRGVLRNRNFRLLWLARSVSEFGDSLTILALLVLVNRLTGSTVALAAMTMTLLVPQIIFGLLAGVYVDRLDRRRIMIVSDLLRGGLVLGFGLVGSVELLWLVYLLGLLQASIGTLFNPAQNALLPTVLPEGALLSANSLTQTSRIVSIALGGAVAGVLIGVTGLVWPIFVLDALTFFWSVLLVSRVVVPPFNAQTRRERSAQTVFKELGDGVKITFQNRVLFGTLVAGGISILGMGAANVLFIPLLVNELHSSESWLGPIQIAATVGTIASGSLVALLASHFRPTFMISGGLVLLGMAVGFSGLVAHPWQLMLCQFAVGWLVVPINTAIVTLNQMAVGDELRGRVGAARITVMSVSQLLSMAVSGVLGDLIGVRPVFVMAAGVVIVAGLASGQIFRATARLEEQRS